MPLELPLLLLRPLRLLRLPAFRARPRLLVLLVLLPALFERLAVDRRDAADFLRFAVPPRDDGRFRALFRPPLLAPCS